MLGKKIRLERIIDRKSGKMIIVPMDHGLTIGTVKGLENMPKMINDIAFGNADAVLMHNGIAEAGHRGSFEGEKSEKDIGLIIHLSGSTTLSPFPNAKVLVCSVEQALSLGADAVSIHVNIGANEEPDMLRQMGKVAESCRRWGLPLLAMMYPRGPNIDNPNDPKVVNIAARAGAEMGADIVKTLYTGDIESMKEIVNGCPVPIIIAGGPKMATKRDLFQTVYDAVIGAGAAGIAMGRNVFQDDNPTLLLKTLSKIVHKGLTVDEALKATNYQL